MTGLIDWHSYGISDAQRRLSEAKAAGDSHAQVDALVELFALSYRGGAYEDAVAYADEAWETAQANLHWDQLARMARLFGDVSLAAGQYERSYDHFANACAYGAVAGTQALAEAVSRVDEVVDKLVTTGRTRDALALCDMLLAYEAAGGLGRPMPEFAAHVERLRKRPTEQSLLEATRDRVLN